jgi:chemotaxis protein methyltransferase CheR
VITLQGDEYKAMADYIYSLCAITLDQTKGYLIESRLSHLVEELGCRSFRDLMARAKAETNGAIKRRIIDGITTNETSFFRDSAPFDLLRYKLIPELVDRRKASGGNAPIRIWSAACSTGQEIYSVAMVLKEVLGDPYRHGVRLVGTDISDEAVSKASKGIFTPVEISRGLSDSLRGRYFRQVAGGWQIADELRALTSFKHRNLMMDLSDLGKFDVVLCRNVAIYFNGPDKIALFGRLERALDRDGALVIGAMESLSGICPQFESKRYQRAVFYQVKGTGAPVPPRPARDAAAAADRIRS